MIEIWKDVVGYEGLYKVSNMGRVKSLERIVNAPQNGGKRFVKGKIIKQSINGGYYKVSLCMHGIVNSISVHRLVAEAFILNPHNKRTVNHINGIKIDNKVDNLEFATYKENAQHAYDIGLMSNNHSKKKVLMTSLDNNPLFIFDSLSEASRKIEISTSCISQCCSGKRKTAGGYKWEYCIN